MYCKRVVKVEGEGPYDLPEGPGPEYESAAVYGPNLMNTNLPSVLKLNELSNRYGVDSISCGATIAFAMECYEKGLITKDDLDGDELRWGEPEDIMKMFDKIVNRKGFGDLLAEGSRAAAKKIGNGSEKFFLRPR